MGFRRHSTRFNADQRWEGGYQVLKHYNVRVTSTGNHAELGLKCVAISFCGAAVRSNRARMQELTSCHML